MQLALAPLQTYTDFHFRNAIHDVYGGIDKYYAPYLKLNNDGTIKNTPKIDILPKNNALTNIIPQLMACNSDDFFVMANYISDLGYTELNWNMGCPYPMVTRKSMGAGILNQPDELFRMLDSIYPKLNMKLGLKMRMGMDDTSDILELLPRLNDYPLTEIIIHARNAKQLYTGTCDVDQFKNCIALSKHTLVYNGDIVDLESFQQLQKELPSISNWFIGRGALMNPMLFNELKTNRVFNDYEYTRKIIELSEKLVTSLTTHQKDKGYALTKMKGYWEYLAMGIPNGKNYYRKLKKMNSIIDFMDYIKSEMA
jgi:tRNA-dihydrouridine synthase B